MKRHSPMAAAALVAVGLAFSNTPSLAQIAPHTPVTTPVNPGFFYWSLGASGGVRHLPKWSFGEFVTFGEFGAPLNRATGFPNDPKPWGAGPEFVMGYALNRGSALGGLGDAPRLELALSTFFGRSSQSNEGGTSTQTFLFPFVDGSGRRVLSADVPAKLETTVYAGETAFRFKTAFKTSKRFQIIPSIAAIGGMASYRYEWQRSQFESSTLNNEATVKETIRSWHVGAEAALHLKWQAGPRWSLHGGASIAAMYRRSDLSALSQLNLNFPKGSEYLSNTASDNANTFAWRLGLNLGVTYDWGWARLTIAGFGYFDSAVPGVVNPENGASLSPNDYTPARLTHSGEWAYGGRIALVFPLSMGR